MALDARIRELGSRHQSLEQAIQDEMRRPYSDDIKLQELKRQKLRLKEMIESLKEKVEQERRGFLNLIEQQHGIGVLTKALAENSAFDPTDPYLRRRLATSLTRRPVTAMRTWCAVCPLARSTRSKWASNVQFGGLTSARFALSFPRVFSADLADRSICSPRSMILIDPSEAI